MWSSLVKIKYTELKLSCGNDPVVNNSIYSNDYLDLWPNDLKINRVLPRLQRNHMAKFGKDPIYRTKVIVLTPVWTPARPPYRPPTRHTQSHNMWRVHRKGERTKGQTVIYNTLLITIWSCNMNPTKIGDKLMCFRSVRSSCSTSCIHRLTNPVISQEWGTKHIVILNRKSKWSDWLFTRFY
jgi:hypothetical protein